MLPRPAARCAAVGCSAVCCGGKSAAALWLALLPPPFVAWLPSLRVHRLLQCCLCLIILYIFTCSRTYPLPPSMFGILVGRIVYISNANTDGKGTHWTTLFRALLPPPLLGCRSYSYADCYNVFFCLYILVLFPCSRTSPLPPSMFGDLVGRIVYLSNTKIDEKGVHCYWREENT